MHDNAKDKIIMNFLIRNVLSYVKGRGSHLQTIPIIMNFGMDEKYTVMIICMKSQKCTLKNF